MSFQQPLNQDTDFIFYFLRNLTTTYQKLLAQATKEITKLNLEIRELCTLQFVQGVLVISYWF